MKHEPETHLPAMRYTPRDPNVQRPRYCVMSVKVKGLSPALFYSFRLGRTVCTACDAELLTDGESHP